jgi:hypothetical protein
MYPGCVRISMQQWREHLQSQFPPGFPHQIEVVLRRDRRRWPSVPWEVEREVAFLHATEWCLHYPRHVEWWWDPLRKGQRPRCAVPSGITVHYEQIASDS